MSGASEFLRVFLGFNPHTVPENKVRLKMLYPRRTLRKGEEYALKRMIRERLYYEDYTCRLPRVKHRYKLRRELIMYGGFVQEVWR